jgi:hypothetical protein
MSFRRPFLQTLHQSSSIIIPMKRPGSGSTPPGTPPECVYGELYSSKAYIDKDRKIQFVSLPEDDPDKDIPQVIAAMSIASDATKLGQFRVSKAWPVYIFFGNQSKYEQNKPSAYATHHVTHLPSVSHLVPPPE